MIDYDQALNEEQRRVVMEGDGPLLVIAGAGSGKTRALTYRVARLIETGVSPARIMLATFTNKAARSMLARVQSLVGDDLRPIWGGTFHHLANRTLRRHASRLGYEPGFTIADSEDARQLINACIAEAQAGRTGEKFPKGDVIREIVSLSVNTGRDMAEVILQRYPFFSHLSQEIGEVAARYARRKRKEHIMDFDDLLLNWRRLLSEQPDLSEQYAERFLHILVDEYQDTNRLQAEIIDLLAARHRNVMVVGDDSQSIYSFRGANFANIMRFPERYPDCRIFKLETNYRSTPEILHLANLSIVNNENQFAKTLRPIRRTGLKPIVVPLKSDVQQANFVAQRLLELVGEGIPLHELAVLYRAHYHSMNVQMELTRRGIPFEIRSGIRFFEQAHVKDVTAYLRVVVNPLDEPAWKRILGLYPKVGKATADKVWRYLSARENPLRAVEEAGFPALASKAAQPGLAALQRTLLALFVSDRTPAAMIDVVLERGYQAFLEQQYTDMAARREDLEQLANFSGRFEGLEDFLAELSLLAQTTEEGESDRENGREGRVVLSTIHQAKGLEWSVVFLISCADGMIPLARCLKEPEGEEEERRLFYVASTRAKDQLYLSYPLLDYQRGSGYDVLAPSRFISEITPVSRRLKDSPFEQWDIGYED